MIISYAILPDRVKAAFIDSVVLVAAMYGVAELFTLFDDVPTIYRIVSFVFVFILYDPILTSIYGGTIGHSFSKILVKKEDDPSKNISFPLALIRFIVKLLLGWLSLLTVGANDQRKAIHDFAAKSIVIKETSEK